MHLFSKIYQWGHFNIPTDNKNKSSNLLEVKLNTYRPVKNRSRDQKPIWLQIQLTWKLKNIKGTWSREPNNFFLTLKIIPLWEEDHMQEVWCLFLLQLGYVMLYRFLILDSP